MGYKKWTEQDKAYLLSLTNEDISIDETELRKQRTELRKKKERDLAVFAKEIGDPQPLFDIIQAAVSSVMLPLMATASTISVAAPWEV